MIAGRGSCARLVPPPRRVVTLLKLIGGAIGIRDIAGNEDGSSLVVEEAPGGKGATRTAHTNVAGTHEDACIVDSRRQR
jgi:hypothetical protein